MSNFQLTNNPGGGFAYLDETEPPTPDFDALFPDTIYDATKARCIEEQDEARTCAYHIQDCVAHGSVVFASTEQRIAARHYEQMWMRLAQLIGAEG